MSTLQEHNWACLIFFLSKKVDPVNNYPTRCNNIQFIYICKLLCMFRVVSPPINHQELISLYLRYLSLLRPLLLLVVNVTAWELVISSYPVTFTTGSSNGLNNDRYCRYRGADKSWDRPERKQARKHFRWRALFQRHRDASYNQVLPLQGKALKEIHAILTETLVCFLHGRAKDFSTPVQWYEPLMMGGDTTRNT